MRIIVEGCDGTGKTTLINKLKYHFPEFYRVKTSQPKTNSPIQEYVESYKETQNGNYIFDRYRIGEMIYGPIYRGKGLCESGVGVMKTLTSNDVYIITHTDPETIKKVFEDRGEDFTKQEHIQKINDFYKLFIMENATDLNIIAYDFTQEGKDIDQFITDFVLPFIEKNEELI